MAAVTVTTVGEALGALYADISGLGSGFVLGTLSVTWQVPAGAQGPGFRLVYNQLAPPHTTITTNYVVAGGAPYPAPLTWALMPGAPNRQFAINSGAAAFTGVDIVTIIADCFGGFLNTYCGAVVGGLYINQAIMAGKTKPYIANAFIFASTDLDVKCWQVAITDNSTQANNAQAFLAPSVLVGQNGNGITQVYVAASTSSDLPLDLDVAINNGANIFSVFSKTFTEPAGGS